MWFAIALCTLVLGAAGCGAGGDSGGGRTGGSAFGVSQTGSGPASSGAFGNTNATALSPRNVTGSFRAAPRENLLIRAVFPGPKAHATSYPDVSVCSPVGGFDRVLPQLRTVTLRWFRGSVNVALEQRGFWSGEVA